MAVVKTYDELLKENQKLKERLAGNNDLDKALGKIWGKSTLAMMIVSTNDRIVEINPQASLLFDKKPKEIVGKKIYELLNIGDAVLLMDRLHKLSNDNFYQNHLCHLHINSQKKTPVTIQIEPIQDSTPKLAFLLILTPLPDGNDTSPEIQKREFLLKEAQRIAGIGYYLLDIPTGKWDNSSLENLFGLPYGFNKDIAGWLSIIHPDDRKMMSDYFNYEIIGISKAFDKQYRIIRLDNGVTRWVHGKGVLNYDGDDKPVTMMGYIQDITESKNYETDIKIAQQLYQDLVETSQDLIFQCDAEGQFVFVNNAWEKALGYKYNEMIGRKFPEFILPEMVEEVILNFTTRIYDEGSITGFESIFVSKDGFHVYLKINARVVVNENGTISGIRGNGYDITDKRNAEDLARHKSEELKNFFDLTRELLSVGDINGTFLRVNPEWSRVLGYSISEIRHKTAYDFVHPDDLEITKIATKELNEQGKLLNFTNRWRCSNGHYKFIEWRSVQKRGAVYSAARDITSRIELEESLRKANNELREINAQKDKFLYIIAHDIRNPLSNILGFIEILTTHFHENSKEENYHIIRLLNANSNALYELIENLLNWALSQSGKIKYVPGIIPLQNMVSKAINQVKSLAQIKNIEIYADIPSSAFVWADEVMILTVMRNLISNAIKFSFPNSSIQINYSQEDPFVTLEVKDNGVGINSDILQNLFSVETTSSTPGTAGECGTGFGLPLCRELMKLHNGSVYAQSEPGKGSSFFIKIPQSKQ
jgi:PAS domain S-box-containing protein